jgi:6-phosphofructokinase 1
MPHAPSMDDLRITTLGECRHVSPLDLSKAPNDGLGDFVTEQTRILHDIEIDAGTSPTSHLSFEKAGPRERLFFEPESVTAAIVTCGGLCPGINNVIHSIYSELTRNYRVKAVLGIRHGYRGLNPEYGLKPVTLEPNDVEDIHKLGGTVLGTSRGPQDPAVIVDFLLEQSVNILFCIGGDGTQRGAHAIAEEVQRRGLPIAIVGIPKTIDNDITFVDRTFGYFSALEAAQKVLRGAHVEARAAVNGVALVELMGRNAGFIAAGAAMASQEMDFILVPEIPFPLEGDDGLLQALEKRMRRRSHAVIVVAEGAGQHLLLDSDRHHDASGNIQHGDIGPFLRERITQYFADREFPISLKYIDPSYTIRSVPANCADRLLCDQLARHAAHAAMAGKTDLLIGLRHGAFIHVPIAVSASRPKQLDVEGDRWTSVLLSTGQPRWR